MDGRSATLHTGGNTLSIISTEQHNLQVRVIDVAAMLVAVHMQ